MRPHLSDYTGTSNNLEQSQILDPGSSGTSRLLTRHAATTGHLDQLRQEAEQEHGGDERPLTPSLQSITKMGTYPLQRAGAFADYLNKTSKRMSSLLATESMGYVEKVSGMWKGGGKHYDEPAGLRVDDDDLEEDADGKVQTSMERFRAHFALPDTERLHATYLVISCVFYPCTARYILATSLSASAAFCLAHVLS